MYILYIFKFSWGWMVQEKVPLSVQDWLRPPPSTENFLETSAIAMPQPAATIVIIHMKIVKRPAAAEMLLKLGCSVKGFVGASAEHRSATDIKHRPGLGSIPSVNATNVVFRGLELQVGI